MTVDGLGSRLALRVAAATLLCWLVIALGLTQAFEHHAQRPAPAAFAPTTAAAPDAAIDPGPFTGELSAPVRSRLVWSLAVSGLLLVGTAFATGRGIAGRVDDINRAAGSLADGRYTPPTSSVGDDELARLSNTLAAVAGTLARERAQAAQAARRLRRRDRRHTLALWGGKVALWDWDLVNDRIYLSGNWWQMLGLDPAHGYVAADEWFERIHPDDRAAVRAAVDHHIARQTPELETRFRVLHANGRLRRLTCRGLALYNGGGQAVRMTGIQADRTERLETELRLRHDAMHDPLTGLANRALLLDRIQRTIERGRRHEAPRSAVLFLDLDRFKTINDGIGHLAGDRLLVEASRRISRLLRPADTVARIGGDEFVILLDEIATPTDATRVAERIQEELGRSFEIGGHRIHTSTSIGIVIGTDGHENAAQILRDADTAMYRAKSGGRARYAIFDPEMHTHAVAELVLEEELREALPRNQFELRYQPIVSFTRRTIIGFEALLRWNHPHRGLLRPGEFLALAERTQLAPEIGRWTLAQAIRTIAEWNRLSRRQPISVAVNLTPSEFHQAGFCDQVGAILRDSGLDPGLLKLEITEAAIQHDLELTVAICRTLRARGVGIHLDGFGSDYCSLMNLRRVPLDALKIDLSLAPANDRPEDVDRLLGGILRLSDALGIDLVAVGVENEAQLSRLADLGCLYVQGHHFYEPMLAADARRRALSGRG